MNNEKEFALKVQEQGGVLYRVGGAVRDMLRGVEPNDDDYCVTGFDKESFQEAFPTARQVIGKDGKKKVDVFLVKVGDEIVEVALARIEIKNGKGYDGFKFISRKDITIYQDLHRRDMKMNSIALNVLTNEIIDPYGGREDIKNKVISATSDAFYEDPTRVYRVAVRYAKDEGYVVEERTKEMMIKASSELKHIAIERVVAELEKALLSPQPDKFFRLLQELGILHIHFEPISRLNGVLQPAIHHPEGDAFEHVMRAIKAMTYVSDNIIDRFAIMMHDVGKGLTPKEKWPAHHGHEEAGVPVVKEWCEAMKIPTKWKQAAMTATKLHGKFHRLDEMRNLKIVDLLLEADRSPLGVEGLAKVALSDARGKANPHEEHPNYEFALHVIEEIKQVKGKRELEGKKAGEDKRKRQGSIVGELKTNYFA